jgi:hypothetical protein
VGMFELDPHGRIPPHRSTSSARSASVISATVFARARTRSRRSAARCFCSSVGALRVLMVLSSW